MRRLAILSIMVVFLGVQLGTSVLTKDVLASEITNENTNEITDENIDEIINENTNENTDEIINENANESNQALQKIVNEHTIMALVYLSDAYPIRGEASFNSNAVVTVPSGQQVQIKDVVIDENQQEWVRVTLTYHDQTYEGYISRGNLACSDERFLKWEKEYVATTQKPSARLFAAATNYADIEQFPDSYKASLAALKQAHPNWTFVKMNTNLDWNTVVTEEMKDGKSLIESSFPDYMQNGLYGGGWSYASKDALQYYLDPRNGLTENYIFQFELLTYNKTYHTEAAVRSFLSNTFMTGNAPKTQMNYANIFWTVGSGQNVSPFHLASRVFQEQGKGGSPLISGTYPGYEGYYNFFNIGAFGTTDKAVYETGLAKAKLEGWTDGYKSILGGTQVISANYILKGQDTLYLQKFDVDGSYYGTFWHQYMQNICAPSSEATSTRKLYSNANSLDNTFVFKIPVYNNMPATACAKPTANTSANETASENSASAATEKPVSSLNAVLSENSYIYDGKLKTPTVTIKDGNKKLTKDVDYTVGYPDGRINVGTYTVTITGKGSYTGTLKKDFTITRASQSISAESKTKAYGSAAFGLGAKVAAGDGKLSYQSSNTSVCTVSNTGKITIKGIGKASITITAAQTANYNKAAKKITITVNPKKGAISAVTSPSSKKVKAVWKKDTTVTGYQVQIAANKTFTSAKKTATITKKTTTAKTFTGLKKGQTYYVRVRAYKTIDGKKQYGAWSTIKSVKCK